MDTKYWGDTHWNLLFYFTTIISRSIENLKKNGKEDVDIDITKFNITFDMLDNFNGKEIKDLKLLYGIFIKSSIITLPCSECSSHAKNYLKIHPFPYNVYKEWHSWLYKLRSAVSQRINTTLIPKDKMLLRYLYKTTPLTPEDIIDSIFAVILGYYGREDDSTKTKNIYKLYFKTIKIICSLSPILRKFSEYLVVDTPEFMEVEWEWIKNIAIKWEENFMISSEESIYPYDISSVEAYVKWFESLNKRLKY